MYFSGKLTIKPAQETIVHVVKPTHMFGKVFHFLTAGMNSEKEEHQTFTALSILQQLNIIFRRCGITNIVRLAKDDFNFYLDAFGVDDDLQEAMDQFELRVDKIESDVFQSLFLVLEHEDTDLRYLVEIDIQRIHKLGDAPITVRVNGVLKQFNLEWEDTKVVKQKMASIFEDQAQYDAFLREKQHVFEQFVGNLEQSIRTHMKVDSLERAVESKMIRPKESIKNPKQIERQTMAEPIFYGYHGFGDAFFYAWIWSELCFHHHIHCHNFTLVDGTGSSMMAVGDQGFNAGDSNTLNPEENFEAPSGSDIEYFNNHEYQGDFELANLVEEPTSSGTEEENNWMEVYVDDSSVTESSCSSCSGCGGD